MSSGCDLYCFPCSRRFTSQEELSSHLRDHLQDKHESAYMKLVESYVCEKCSKKFGNKSDLYSHYADHYFQSHFTCKSCGFICMNVSLLTLHELSCKQVNIIKISNANSENVSNNFSRETAFSQYSMSSYSTWQVVHSVNYSSTTYSADVSSNYSNLNLKSEKPISRNDSYDIRTKIHVCDVCSKSFSRRCVLDAHRQKHAIEEEENQSTALINEQLQMSRENKLRQIAYENERQRMAHISIQKFMENGISNEEIQLPNVEEDDLHQTAQEIKQLQTDQENDNRRKVRQSSKKVQSINKVRIASKRKTLTIANPCSASEVNKLPSRTACKKQNNRRSSVKKSRKMRRKCPVRYFYNLRSKLKACKVTPVKESLQNALKTPGSLQSAHKISGSLLSDHKTSGSLQNAHKNSTGVEHSHSCNICLKAFKDNFKLRRHSLIHTGERPFACAKCDRRFSRKDHLNRHFNISCNYENAVRPFPCDKCDKAFKVKWGLFKHSFVHNNSKPYACEKCRKCFAQKYRLLRHFPSCIKKKS